MNRLRMRSSAALLVTLITGAACSRKGPSPSSPSETTAASLNERASEPVRGPGEATKPADPKGLVAFPGAEGYGAAARGGRGGKVCHVTSNKKEGPGTLDACLKMHGPRTVVFFGLTDPVIEGPLEIPEGALTLAGQTAPLGVTIRGGLVCDNVYDPNKCNDLVIRHVRFRAGAPDSLRLGGTHDVMIDHCSFAQADDENIEITRSKNISVQYSVVAEPEGEHYKWGGVLINYAKDVLPLDGISIHHTVWNGVAGRLPEISCEENGDGPGKTACSGRTLHIDLAHNVLFDTQDPIWYNRCTGTNEGNECAPSPKNFLLALNLVGNVMLRRAGSDAPLIEQAVWAAPGNRVYSADNHLFVGGKEVPVGGGKSAAARLPGPSIRETKASALVSELVTAVRSRPEPDATVRAFRARARRP